MPDDVIDPASLTALRSLSERYAHAADRGDAEMFAAVFHDDGRLEVHNPTGASEPAVRLGHELAAIPGRLRRYDATFHMLGQSTYDIAGDRATGETYCMAHHLTRNDDGATDAVMFIRYVDDYRRDAGAGWRIDVRRVMVDWTEHRTVS